MTSRRGVPISAAGVRLLQRLDAAREPVDATALLGTSPAAWNTMQVLANRWLVTVRGGKLAIRREGRVLLRSIGR